MKITIVTETYFPQVNGVSRTLGQLVKFLEGRGDQIQLIRPDYGEESECSNHVLVHAVPLPFYPEVRLPPPTFGEVLPVINAFQPHLVHIATEAVLGLAVLRHALKREIPVVSSFHTNFDRYCEHYQIAWASWLIRRYLRWFHNSTLQTFVPSRATIAELEAYGIERLALWPRGVDASLFHPDRPGRERIREKLDFDANDIVIAYVGRIAAEKNTPFLAEALAIAANARPDVRLLFVGDGPERRGIERKLDGCARFVGYRSGEDLADHYAAADLFAFSSLTETFGNVVIEAMASGLPVVALAAGGVADSVQTDVNGIALDPSASPAEFAAAVLKLVDDREAAERLSQGARRYARSRTWEAIMAKLRDRYVEIVAEFKK